MATRPKKAIEVGTVDADAGVLSAIVPHPALIELVKLLARAAAREDAQKMPIPSPAKVTNDDDA